MRTAAYDEVNPNRTGLPRWALFAATPFVLAVGFVTGIALSSFWPASERSEQVARQEQTAPSDTSGNPSNPPPFTLPGPSSGSQSSGSGPAQASDGHSSAGAFPLPPAVDEPLPYLSRTYGPTGGFESPATGSNRPIDVYGRREVRTLLEARAALNGEYDQFLIDGKEAFAVDYQVARDANYNTVLIGIVKIADYDQWVRAVRDHPARLQSWLTGAAQRVRPAALNEAFTLTWTIFETVSTPPSGFASTEVTTIPRDGGYVVTRPLAALTDADKATVTIAAVESQANLPASTRTPWATYGPVLRFDPTDLYRPVRNTAPTKP